VSVVTRHQHEVDPAETSDDLEIAGRTVGQLRVEDRQDGRGTDATDAQRVAVGCGFRHEVDADRARCARPVVDDERLLEDAGELGGKDAGIHIRCAAWREGND
jgi:hypothetical protein